MFVLFDKNISTPIICSSNKQMLENIKSEIEYYNLFYDLKEYSNISDSLISNILIKFNVGPKTKLIIEYVQLV
jgi:hypothetical protein